MYLFVLAIVVMATAASLVALASTDGLLSRASAEEDAVLAELQAGSAEDLAFELIAASDDPLDEFSSGYIVDYKVAGEVSRAWLTDFDGNAVSRSGAGGVRLWSEGIRSNARALRSVDLDLFADADLDGSSAVVDEEPVAYWPLGTPGGTFAREVIGSAHGIFAGGVEVGGTAGPLFAPAPLFDGVDGRVVIPHEDWMRFDAWTLSMWVRADADPSREQVIISKAAEVGTGHFEIVRLASGSIAVRDGKVAGTNVVSSDGATTKGSWHHLVVNFKDNAIKIYVDGTMVGTGGGSGLEMDSRNQEPIVIGAGQQRALPGTGEPVNDAFVGSIAEVALFDDDLPNETISDLYDAGRGGTPGIRVISGTVARRAD